MGSESVDSYDDEKPIHRVHLVSFLISRIPITNAQYALFIKAEDLDPPGHWDEGKVPKGMESHPVVNVSWFDALAYCRWLGEATGKSISLPTEAQWEKAARGDQDQREYPWGDNFETTRCNTWELGLRSTTPAGIFKESASPYGVFDLSGNLYMWTLSTKKDYPYTPQDGRNAVGTKGRRVVRGGSWLSYRKSARCAYRLGYDPNAKYDNIGFRIVVSLVDPVF